MRTDNRKLVVGIIFGACAAVFAVVLGVVLLLLRSDRIAATTMRLLRLEGIVRLEDEGREQEIVGNMKLKSGNALDTEEESLASIGLDDTKIVTLEERSRAEFNQDGRMLDLLLTKGSLFFEVSKALEDDEQFDIRTSTMVVGIRGTSGYVCADEEGHETLTITDGVVEVTGTNPVTGEVKTVRVSSGEKITVYLYNDRTVDSIEFSLDEQTEEDLKPFVLDRLNENEELLDKVCSYTGWDKEKIIALGEGDALLVKGAPAEAEAGSADTAAEGASNEGAGERSARDAADAAALASTGAGNASTGRSTAAAAEGTSGSRRASLSSVAGTGASTGERGDAAAANSTSAATGRTGAQSGSAATTRRASSTGTTSSAASSPAQTIAAVLRASDNPQLPDMASQVKSADASTGVLTLADGTTFDPAWYAKRYPDVAAQLGSSPNAMLWHYLTHGKEESRYPTATAEARAQMATASRAAAQAAISTAQTASSDASTGSGASSAGSSSGSSGSSSSGTGATGGSDSGSSAGTGATDSAADTSASAASTSAPSALAITLSSPVIFYGESLTVRVTDKETGEAVSGVTVTAVSDNRYSANLHSTATTSESGACTLAGLFRGFYTISAAADDGAATASCRAVVLQIGYSYGIEGIQNVGGSGTTLSGAGVARVPYSGRAGTESRVYFYLVAETTATGFTTEWSYDASALRKRDDLLTSGMEAAFSISQSGTSTLTATITGTSDASLGTLPTPVSRTFTLNAEAIVSVTGIALSQMAVTVGVDETTALTATVSPANATFGGITWTSSDESVATVDDGEVTGLSPGTAVITATTNDGGYTARCTVTVRVSVTGISAIAQTASELYRGGTVTLAAQVRPAAATDTGVDWTNDADSGIVICEVSDAGEGVWYCTVSAAESAEGEQDVTFAATTRDGGYTASCAVMVYNYPVAEEAAGAAYRTVDVGLSKEAPCYTSGEIKTEVGASDTAMTIPKKVIYDGAVLVISAVSIGGDMPTSGELDVRISGDSTAVTVRDLSIYPKDLDDRIIITFGDDVTRVYTAKVNDTNGSLEWKES